VSQNNQTSATCSEEKIAGDSESTLLSPSEADAIAVIRLNKATPRLEVRREFRIGRLRAVYNRRSRKNLWGRFGGGWNWRIGVDIGGSTVIVNLLVASLRFEVVRV
jgi:hypothetical protein